VDVVEEEVDGWPFGGVWLDDEGVLPAAEN
jgi:hypothetical protein